uniref:Uncharacterized protein n=1 Tax=Octopus bimaculoides TaxID=37653 RepID=A0A0L8HGE2_OCTBM
MKINKKILTAILSNLHRLMYLDVQFHFSMNNPEIAFKIPIQTRQKKEIPNLL